MRKAFISAAVALMLIDNGFAQSVELSNQTKGILPVARGGAGSAPDAANEVPVTTSSSTTVWKGLPSCSNDGAHALVFDASSHTFSCASISVPSTVTPSGSDGDLQTKSGSSLGNISPGIDANVVVVRGGVWISGHLTYDDIGPAFDFTAFSCSTCGTYEIGATIASPTNFTATFSSTPISASVTDGTHTNALSSPFTSGSLAYSYACSSQGNVASFVYTAIGATTKTRGGGINCQPRTFYGFGSSSAATGATASGTTAVLVGATGTLGSWGLPTNSGTLTLSPSNQYIYFLLSTGGHTFTVNGFAAAFSCSSVMFTNVYGSAMPMQLCVSPTFYNATNMIVGVS